MEAHRRRRWDNGPGASAALRTTLAVSVGAICTSLIYCGRCDRVRLAPSRRLSSRNRARDSEGVEGEGLARSSIDNKADQARRHVASAVDVGDRAVSTVWILIVDRLGRGVSCG
jgi:hypothetical protein